MVTHSLTMLEKNLVYAGDSSPRNFTTKRVKRRSIKSEDPMSHRIIEKRRRDRMNNCLADLSRLIPPEYLKKGRGRIEKTEIIEMAIKHIGHLQNAIASTRFNENSNSGSVPSPSSFLIKETSTVSLDQPPNLKHYKMGYLECMSEAMHFLVEVQGYFAGDSLCVQMINHLRKHCDKLMNENTFNFGKKQTGGEGTRSESSGSPINATFNGSSPLGMSHSVGSPSDDNQQHQEYPIDGYYSPKRYLDLCCSLKGHLDNSYPKYVESDGVESENRSDTEPQSNATVKCLSGERIMEDSKTYCEPEGTCHRMYPVLTSFTEAGNHGGVPVKEENGGSQLREMLTSPTSGNVGKREASPTTSTASNHEVGSSENKPRYSSGGKGDDPAPGNGEINHVIMYKFKNNIKQRFSKEKKKNGECDTIDSQVPLKKTRLEECQKCEDSLMKERLALMDRAEPETEETINLNNEETKRRFPLDSDYQNGDLSNRLNFGHRANERGATKRWEDSNAGLYYPQKPWLLSPTSSFPHYGLSGPCKGPYLDREFPPLLSNSYNGLTTSSGNPGPGIPIFALHAKGSFYVPLTLDQATLAPFLTLLGLSKVSNSENSDEKRVLHPVTISVNFQSHLIR